MNLNSVNTKEGKTTNKSSSDFNDISIIQYDELWGKVQAMKERLIEQIEGL